jgi:hypothetical protein
LLGVRVRVRVSVSVSVRVRSGVRGRVRVRVHLGAGHHSEHDRVGGILGGTLAQRRSQADLLRLERARARALPLGPLLRGSLLLRASVRVSGQG